MSIKKTLESEIKRLEKQLKELEKKKELILEPSSQEIIDLVDLIRNTANEHCMQECEIYELIGEHIKKRKKRKSNGPVPPKYRHPFDKSRTWTGRGRSPVWIVEYVNGGGNLADLLIEKEDQEDGSDYLQDHPSSEEF